MNGITIPPAVQDLMASLMPRQPRYRYFEGPHKEMYCWTTERVNGKYICFDYIPYGKGSRSGNPTQWKLKNKIKFAKRKVAKARALKRYLKAIGQGE